MRRRRLVTIAGSGRLAAAMSGALLRRGGVRIAIAARNPRAARDLARRRPGASVVPWSALGAARVLLLAVPDDAIAPVAREIARLAKSFEGTVVLHAAGALGVEPLSPLARRGASTGVLHPLAVLGRSGAERLEGAAARIEGAPRAVRAARAIARSAGLRPLPDAPFTTGAARADYHAAASLAPDHLVGRHDAARAILVRRGIGARAATRALASLARGVVDQMEAHGTRGALTGPAARGDARTLARHLESLARYDPDIADAHRALSRRLARVAREAGELSPSAARALAAILRRGPRRERAV